ncbi:hypothetical protein HQS1_34550 [Delftia lacustris]|nr:hypothetical protein HQS1_34550 [Delftia lacustris]
MGAITMRLGRLSGPSCRGRNRGVEAVVMRFLGGAVEVLGWERKPGSQVVWAWSDVDLGVSIEKDPQD